MENNDNMILSSETVGKEYQIPELVDLNGIGEAIGAGDPCYNGSSAGFFGCGSGTVGSHI